MRPPTPMNPNRTVLLAEANKRLGRIIVAASPAAAAEPRPKKSLLSYSAFTIFSPVPLDQMFRGFVGMTAPPSPPAPLPQAGEGSFVRAS